MEAAIVFYGLSFFMTVLSLGVLFNPNPIMSALYLVLTMIGVSLVFFMLDAGFLAGVQLIVYAGAVLVLFVMVIMLFDLKREVYTFSRGFFTRLLKVFTGVVFLIILVKSFFLVPETKELLNSSTQMTTKNLAGLLFTEYIFVFELLGLLLLAVAIGAVALSRIKGGTHAE